MLKRNLQPAKTISRPEPVVTQSKSEPAKPQPTSDAGVGGSSLDNGNKRDDDPPLMITGMNLFFIL